MSTVPIKRYNLWSFLCRLFNLTGMAGSRPAFFTCLTGPIGETNITVKILLTCTNESGVVVPSISSNTAFTFSRTFKSSEADLFWVWLAILERNVFVFDLADANDMAGVACGCYNRELMLLQTKFFSALCVWYGTAHMRPEWPTLVRG